MCACNSGSNAQDRFSHVVLHKCDHFMSIQLSVECPIHYVTIGDSRDPGHPPNIGLIVWIQYLFAASVQHKACIMIFFGTLQFFILFYVYHHTVQSVCLPY